MPASLTMDDDDWGEKIQYESSYRVSNEELKRIANVSFMKHSLLLDLSYVTVEALIIIAKQYENYGFVTSSVQELQKKTQRRIGERVAELIRDYPDIEGIPLSWQIEFLVSAGL